MSLFSKKLEADPIRLVGDTRGPSEQKERVQRSGRPPYGIAEAIVLMRSVPVEQNVELVVRVIRNTLESMNVHLGDIIEDASLKERSLQQKIDTLRSEMAELEKQIDSRGQEISRLQSELAETTTTKERLVMAQSSAVPSAPVVVQSVPAANTPPPTPKRDGPVPVPSLPIPSAKPPTPIVVVQDETSK